jgi:lipopolysaccharide exporter
VTGASGEELDRRPASSKVAAGAKWNLVQFGAAKLVTFASLMVLARLLPPESFGLLALGLLAVNVFDRLKDLGVGAALIQHPGPLSRVLPSAATVTVCTVTILSLTSLVTAPALAALLGDARLTPLVRALSLALLISGLSVLPDSVLRRRLLFGARAVPEVSGAIVKATVAIGLAATGSGVWSLVWGQLAGAVVTTTAYWIAYLKVRERGPLFGWSGRSVRELVGFGASLSLIALLALILDNLDYFVIGRRLGAEELGFYTLAYRLPELLVISVCHVVGQVLFSSFSRLQEDRAGLAEQYLRASSTVASLTVPLGLGLAAAAPEIVAVVFGPSFAPAAPLLAVLGVYAALDSLAFHAGEVYKATGRSHLLIRLAVVRLAAFAPALWWAAGRSTLTVAWTFLVLHLVFTVVSLLLIRHVLSLRLRDQWSAYWPALLAGVIMAGSVVLLRLPVAEMLPALPRLVLLVVVGAAVYAAALRLLDPAAVRRVLALRPSAAAPVPDEDPL